MDDVAPSEDRRLLRPGRGAHGSRIRPDRPAPGGPVRQLRLGAAYHNGPYGATTPPEQFADKDVDPDARWSDKRFVGVSAEAIYRVLSPYTDGVGLAFYVEPTIGPQFKELETKVILQKNFLDDRLTTAFNFTYAPEWRYLADDAAASARAGRKRPISTSISPSRTALRRTGRPASSSSTSASTTAHPRRNAGTSARADRCSHCSCGTGPVAGAPSRPPARACPCSSTPAQSPARSARCSPRACRPRCAP